MIGIFPPIRQALTYLSVVALFSCATPQSPLPSMNSGSSMQLPETFDLQGHRGARGLAPENAIPAFRRALELGVTTLEMDAVISQDQQVVVSHEPWFSGHICSLPSGAPVPLEEERSYRIYALPYSEIRQFDCGLRGNPRFPMQEKMEAHKPLLKDVIAFAEQYALDHDLPPVYYNIETKSSPAGDNTLHPDPETFTSLLLDVIEAGNVLPRTTVQSFDPRTLRIAHSRHPDMSLALLVGDHDTMDMAGHVANLGFVPTIYSPAYRLVDAELVETAHARGMRVIPWTVNTLPEMQALVKLGVDGLITDYPDLGRQLVDQMSD